MSELTEMWTFCVTLLTSKTSSTSTTSQTGATFGCVLMHIYTHTCVIRCFSLQISSQGHDICILTLHSISFSVLDINLHASLCYWHDVTHLEAHRIMYESSSIFNTCYKMFTDILNSWSDAKLTELMQANPDYKGVCHVALAQEGHCRPGEVLF
jgi:hypothetical protein